MTDPAPVVVVTGMSGAGRSTAAKVLEDIGYFVIDNLPVSLISRVVELSDVADQPERRLAVVVDARGGRSFLELGDTIDWLHRHGVATRMLFLTADDETLLRRFEEQRRPHPVAGDSLADSIAGERRLVEELRGQADVVIDTTDLNVHQLRTRIMNAFLEDQTLRPMRVSMASFGFKHGTPRDVDLLFDVRFLRNPHWEATLRPKTGLDEDVRDYVLESPDAGPFLERVDELLEFLIPRFVAEGKAYLTIGVGCTGGRHRSVAIAERLARTLRDQGISVNVRHRDIDT